MKGRCCHATHKESKALRERIRPSLERRIHVDPRGRGPRRLRHGLLSLSQRQSDNLKDGMDRITVSSFSKGQNSPASAI